MLIVFLQKVFIWIWKDILSYVISVTYEKSGIPLLYTPLFLTLSQYKLFLHFHWSLDLFANVLLGMGGSEPYAFYHGIEETLKIYKESEWVNEW